MKVSSLVCCTAILAIVAPLAAFAQQRPVTLCLVVEAREDGRNLVQYTGMDAQHLAQALSSQSLPNSTPIVPILLIGLRPKAENRVIEQRGCEYVADLERHESVDDNSSGPGPSTDVPPIGDRDMIMLSLRKADSHKVIARMAKPPLTYFGRTHSVKFDPFPLFAKEIRKKISQAQGAD